MRDSFNRESQETGGTAAETQQFYEAFLLFLRVNYGNVFTKQV